MTAGSERLCAAREGPQLLLGRRLVLGRSLLKRLHCAPVFRGGAARLRRGRGEQVCVGGAGARRGRGAVQGGGAGGGPLPLGKDKEWGSE